MYPFFREDKNFPEKSRWIISEDFSFLNNQNVVFIQNQL